MHDVLKWSLTKRRLMQKNNQKPSLISKNGSACATLGNLKAADPQDSFSVESAHFPAQSRQI